MLGSHFRAVHGDDNRGHADTDTTDDSGGVKCSDGVRVDDLEDGADTEDGRSQHKGPSTAKSGGEWPDEETGKEGCAQSVVSAKIQWCTMCRELGSPPACKRLVELELTVTLVADVYLKSFSKDASVNTPPTTPVS